MDEGSHQSEQQHGGYYQYPSVPGGPRHVAQQQQQMSPVHSPEGFRRPTAPARRAQASAAASGRRVFRSSGTAGSGFARTEPASLSSTLHFQQPPLQQQQVAPPPGQYGPGVIYNFDQSGAAQMPYTMSLPETFTARQAESLGALSPGVSQYFSHAGHTESVSQYLSAQQQLVAYQQQQQQQQQSALDQRTTAPFTANIMANFNPTGAVGATLNVTDLEDAYNQYQQALIAVFGYTQRGQLSEASRLLLELSVWLIDHARDLGLFRDDPNQHVKHVQLWNDFNICWLSLCQKQKDLTETFMGAGQALPTTMLSAEVMENMGQALIQLCDRVEQHGLVDYQLGIWEEEILDILGQCLDLVEQ